MLVGGLHIGVGASKVPVLNILASTGLLSFPLSIVYDLLIVPTGTDNFLLLSSGALTVLKFTPDSM